MTFTLLLKWPSYAKNFQNLLIWNRKVDELETWYAALSTHILPRSKGRWTWNLVCSIEYSYTTKFFSNDALGLTLTYFTARSNLLPYAFVWEKVKTMDFSEIIVVYDIKVGRCSQLNEYMKLYEFQRSRSVNDFDPNHSDSIFVIFFSSVTADFNTS